MKAIQSIQTKYLRVFSILGNHNVIALIALIQVGAATRVMEAGLACPDWPLCYGSLLPLSHMNLRVFLEWFHRLDAFLVGILIFSQFMLSILWRNYVPNWLPKIYSLLLFLIILQGSFGAITVLNLLDSYTVSAHLLIAFLLLITSIFINQKLKNNFLKGFNFTEKYHLLTPLIFTIIQSAIGVRVSTTWSAHLCLAFNDKCYLLNAHKLFAIPVAISIICLIIVSIFQKNFVKNWKLFMTLALLISYQVTLGFLSLKFELNEPLLIVGHQLGSSLLIAFLTFLIFENSNQSNLTTSSKQIFAGINL